MAPTANPEPLPAARRARGGRDAPAVTALALALWLALGGGARAQPVDETVPIFHGLLGIRPTTGPIDVRTGSATLKIRRWFFTLGKDENCRETNGIFPDQEPLVVDIGTDSFPLPAGALRAVHGGRSFTYRAPGKVGRGIRSLRIAKGTGGLFSLRLTVAGVDFSQLITIDPACLPMAVIVGDDDVFSNLYLSRQSFAAPRFRVFPEFCTPPGAGWPWSSGDRC